MWADDSNNSITPREYRIEVCAEVDADWDVVYVAKYCIAPVMRHEPIKDAPGNNARVLAPIRDHNFWHWADHSPVTWGFHIPMSAIPATDERSSEAPRGRTIFKDRVDGSGRRSSPRWFSTILPDSRWAVHYIWADRR
jgi:hypothetical protein